MNTAVSLARLAVLILPAIKPFVNTVYGARGACFFCAHFCRAVRHRVCRAVFLRPFLTEAAISRGDDMYEIFKQNLFFSFCLEGKN